MKITRQQLFDIIKDSERVTYFLHYINEWSETFGINTNLRICHFLAQCLHETNGLTCTREIGNAPYFKRYESGKLAKMLGNTQVGDGVRYRGRGLIHITGRANYMAYQKSKFCKGDIMENPDLLEKPLGATKSGMWWWWKHGCNKLADQDDILAITKVVNGGVNGLESRKKWLEKCKKVIGI